MTVPITEREQRLLDRLRAACDFAAMNDHRLPRRINQKKGDIAVREALIEAHIEGWKREHGLLGEEDGV